LKRVILIVDAAADFPCEELRDQTPLDVARSPNSRALAEEGKAGVLRLTAHDSSHAMSRLCEVCGFDSKSAAEIRWGPLAARAAGLDPDSSRFRALGHFITVHEDCVGGPGFPDSVAEQEELLSLLCRELGVNFLSFGNGRFVFDMPRFEGGLPASLTPTDLTGKSISKASKGWPEALSSLLQRAEALLGRHPVNYVRVDLGQNPLNGIWLWSGGTLSGVSQSSGIPGQAMMSCEPLALGLGQALGLPTMGMDSPYSLDRVDAAFDVADFLKLLERNEEIVVWVPAPFARGPNEGPEEKVRRLDAIDYYITGPIRAILGQRDDSRLLLLSAGIRHRGLPEKGRAPFVLWGEGVAPDAATAWSEREGLLGSLGTPKFSTLLNLLRT